MSELRRDNLAPFHSQLASVAWEWRLEGGLGLGVMLAYDFVQRLAGATVAQLVVIVLGAGLSRWGALREWLTESLHLACVRRDWARATLVCGLAGPDGSRPVAREVVAALFGDNLLVEMPPGSHTGELAEAAEHLASTLRAREVRVLRDPRTATLAHVVVVRRDPLVEAAVPWPGMAAERCSLWDPVTVGIDENGRAATLTLPERNVLIGGEPGAGKSVLLSVLLSAAALDQTTEITLLDGKLVELAAWFGVARSFAGPDVGQAIEVLGGLRTEMDARYRRLLELGRRKVEPDDDLPLHIVAIDELAFYLGGSDRKQRGEITDLLRDLVSRGRAAGIVVLAATQKPSAEVIPTQIRDLFSFRVALRCSTPQASDTVLGQGWASLGYSAATLDPAARGVGFLLAEGGVPLRFRACHLGDEEVRSIAQRAARLRGLL